MRSMERSVGFYRKMGGDPVAMGRRTDVLFHIITVERECEKWNYQRDTGILQWTKSAKRISAEN